MAMSMIQRAVARLSEKLEGDKEHLAMIVQDVLAELETPTDGMVREANRKAHEIYLKGRMHPLQFDEIKAAGECFSAAIIAAREGK